MPRRAYIKFYTADFLVGITGMTNAQVGMYIQLISLENEKGHLSEKIMRHVCGGVNRAVFDKFLIDGDGNYYTRRGEEGLVEYAELCAKNAENSKKGGRPKNPVGSEIKPKESPVGSEIKPKQNPAGSETQSVEKPTGLFLETKRAFDSDSDKPQNQNTLSLESPVNNTCFKNNGLIEKNVCNTEGARGAAGQPEGAKKYGAHGWVRLTDTQFKALIAEFGGEVVGRHVAIVDQRAQATGNAHKWKDWDLKIRQAIAEKWGTNPAPAQKSTDEGRLHEFERNAVGKYNHL